MNINVLVAALLVPAVVGAQGLNENAPPTKTASGTNAHRLQMCQKYAQYRDGPLFSEWGERRRKLADYQHILDTIQERKADLRAAASKFKWVEAAGLASHLTRTTADLIGGLLEMHPGRVGLHVAFDASRFAVDFDNATEPVDKAKETVKFAAEQIEVRTNPLLQITKVLYTLYENTDDFMEFVSDSGEVKGKLASLLRQAEREMEPYRDMHRATDLLFRELEKVKSQMDRECGQLNAKLQEEGREIARESNSYCVQATNEAKHMVSRGREAEAQQIIQQAQGKCPDILANVAAATGGGGGGEVANSMRDPDAARRQAQQGHVSGPSENAQLFNELLNLGAQSKGSGRVHVNTLPLPGSRTGSGTGAGTGNGTESGYGGGTNTGGGTGFGGTGGGTNNRVPTTTPERPPVTQTPSGRRCPAGATCGVP